GFLGVVHLFGVVLADAAAEVGMVGLDAVLLVLVDLLFALGEGLVHLVGQDLGLVVQLQPALAAAVLRLVGGGVGHGPLDLALGQVGGARSEEHTSELQSRFDLVCRLLLEKKNKS